MKLVNELDLEEGGEPLAFLSQHLDTSLTQYTDRKLTHLAQNDVKTSRNITGTIYQNTSGKIRFATIAVALQVNAAGTSINGTSGVYFYCDANSSPTTLVGESRLLAQYDGLATLGNSGEIITVTLWILPNYYYKAVLYTAGDGATPALESWFETDLF